MSVRDHLVPFHSPPMHYGLTYTRIRTTVAWSLNKSVLSCTEHVQLQQQDSRIMLHTFRESTGFWRLEVTTGLHLIWSDSRWLREVAAEQAPIVVWSPTL